MKVLVTRISKGSVSAKGEVVSGVGKGLVVFVGIERKDSQKTLAKMAEKVANLRIFENEQGKFYYSVKDKNYQILCISNFTLCASTEKGRRPSFEDAMQPEKANALVQEFVELLRLRGIEVQTGEFGARMDIELEMDGPVNIVLSS